MIKNKNNWEKRFGASRRAKDKALLEDCERRIALEEELRAKLAKLSRAPFGTFQ